jgi:flagellum-specific peptidoglycan hydrolase FlgJ
MKKTKTVIFGSLAFMLLILGMTPYSSFVEKELEETLLQEQIEETIYKMNFKYPHIVLAQAKLESSNFNSTIFKENNNLFGMKQARTRPTTATGTSRSHATYGTWKDSIVDYALYSSTYLSGKTENEYYAYLGRNYAQDPEYVTKLRQIVEKENLVYRFKR